MQFPNYQPHTSVNQEVVFDGPPRVPSGGHGGYAQPPQNFMVESRPGQMPRGNTADEPKPTQDPKESQGGIDSSEVALNDNGGITRCMLYMVVEDGPLLPGNGVKKTNNMSYLRSCMVRWAVIPMLMQTLFMYYLCLQVSVDHWKDEPFVDSDGEDLKPEEVFEARCVALLAITIYFWSMADLFFGSTLHQFHLFSRGHYSGCNRVVSILLFIWEIALQISLLVTGTLYVAINGKSPFDAIMNALAVNYILDIDNYITSFTTSMGGYQNAHVPSEVVLSESNADWPGCYQVFVCISNNVICNPILPLIWAYAAVHIVDGGFLPNYADLIFLLSLLAILVLTSDFMCQCYRCACCLGREVDGMDSSSSEAYDLSRGKSDL